jgi:hypothetical protein
VNTTKHFFNTKQQYLNFRAAFAAAQNSPRAKSTMVLSDYYPGQLYKKQGWLTSTHFILFNIIRERHPYIGFTPKTKKSYIMNGGAGDEKT